MVDEEEIIPTQNSDLADYIDKQIEQLNKMDKRKKFEAGLIKKKINDLITIYNRQAGFKAFKKVT